MIRYTCPKCGEAMQSPDSMIGQSEICPKCRNVTTVPEPKAVAVASRAVRTTTRHSQRIWSWCGRHKKFVGSCVVTVVMLTGILGWLLPDWMPRPVLTFETPSDAKEGKFPSRVELAGILAEHGYHPALEEPVSKVFRGRMLHMYPYVIDVNNPEWCCMNLWTPLEDDNQVIAISFDLPSKDLICLGVFQEKLQNENASSAVAASAVRHDQESQKFFSAIIGQELDKAMKSLENWNVISHQETWKIWEGCTMAGKFQMEIIARCMEEEYVEGTIILKDRSWR